MFVQLSGTIEGQVQNGESTCAMDDHEHDENKSKSFEVNCHTDLVRPVILWLTLISQIPTVSYRQSILYRAATYPLFSLIKPLKQWYEFVFVFVVVDILLRT